MFKYRRLFKYLLFLHLYLYNIAELHNFCIIICLFFPSLSKTMESLKVHQCVCLCNIRTENFKSYNVKAPVVRRS